MSSTGQVTSPTENVKLITDALADYAQQTGNDLSENPFTTNLEQSKSSEDIIQLLEEREKKFKEYRAGNRRLIDCLNPAVKVLHRFSGILDQATSLVSRLCHPSESFNMTSLAPLPATTHVVCRDRCSPQRTSLEYAL